MHTVLQSCKSKKEPVDQCSLQVDQCDLQLLIDEYSHRWGDSYRLEDQWWGDKNLTWEEAIARAWESRLWHGKMHSHQCRVAHKLQEGLKIALADKKQPEDFEDFKSVYDWLQSIVARVKGLGATTSYDVARRLGAWLRLEPIVVYLHAGTSAGARNFGVKGETASLSAFPKPIQLLGATHAENFLCIYKNKFFA